MTKKKPNVPDALKSVGEIAPAVRAKRIQQAKPTREGKKVIAGFFIVEASNQFRILGINQGKTGQELLAEALNDLFVKYGKPPIA